MASPKTQLRYGGFRRRVSGYSFGRFFQQLSIVLVERGNSSGKRPFLRRRAYRRVRAVFALVESLGISIGGRDLRSRVLAAVDDGLSCRQAAERFGRSFLAG